MMNIKRTVVTSFITGSHEFISLRFVFLWLSYLLVQGCAPSLVSMDRSELERLKYQPVIHVVHYPAPLLTAWTFEAGLAGDIFIPFGILGGVVGGFASHAAMQAEGEKLMKQCSLEDPSLKVREEVIKSLSSEVGIENFRLVSEPLDSDELDVLRSTFGDSLVMDFKTRGWTLMIEPLSQWTTTRRYYLIYAPRARFIRLRDSKVIWLGYTSFDEKESLSTNSTWDELTENNCTLLKAKLDQAGNVCAQKLAEQLLGNTSVEK